MAHTRQQLTSTTCTGMGNFGAEAWVVTRICEEIAGARSRKGDPLYDATPLVKAVMSALAGVNWNSADGQHVLYTALCHRLR